MRAPYRYVWQVRLVPVLTVRALVGATPLRRRAGEDRRLEALSRSLMLVAFVRNSFESMRNRIVSRASVTEIGMPTGATAGAGDAGGGARVGAGRGAVIANVLKSVMRRPFFVRRQRLVIRDHTGNPTSAGMRPDFFTKMKRARGTHLYNFDQFRSVGAGTLQVS